ncbi:hypothetical protein DPMN_147940 [Dreissena polymorpha]|uniref:Uncharacterized protein n=1 Tax=Dreissena polymorpha TaxID=45954 RepID=A0A9D4J3V2_DREPO|nr:hypothetical protein DPMN_147940 [Dreissena polymorpha]
MHGLKIFHRFHFASALKRMSVIAGHTPPGSMETEYIATVKGAPETIKTMVSRIPPGSKFPLAKFTFKCRMFFVAWELYEQKVVANSNFPKFLKPLCFNLICWFMWEMVE